MLGSRSEPMQSSITACSTGQSANHLHHRGDDGATATEQQGRSQNPNADMGGRGVEESSTVGRSNIYQQYGEN